MTITVGDVLFQDGPVAGLPYPCGYWVVCEVKEARLWVALCGQLERKLAGIASWYEISTEDLCYFTPTGKRAMVRPQLPFEPEVNDVVIVKQEPKPKSRGGFGVWGASGCIVNMVYDSNPRPIQGFE